MLDAGFQLQQSHLQRTGFPCNGMNDPTISNKFFFAEGIVFIAQYSSLPGVHHCTKFCIARAKVFIAEAVFHISQYSFITFFSFVFFVPFLDFVSLVSFDLTLILSFVSIVFFLVHFLF
jgi:hypothetical protein